jgi:hypothetical protein
MWAQAAGTLLTQTHHRIVAHVVDNSQSTTQPASPGSVSLQRIASQSASCSTPSPKSAELPPRAARANVATCCWPSLLTSHRLSQVSRLFFNEWVSLNVSLRVGPSDAG